MPQNVPFFDYTALGKHFEEELTAVFQDVLKRGAFILQRDLEEFEEKAKDFLGVKHFFGVADGTNAIMLALRAAGVKPGDEVILPSHTYVATAAAVHYVGAVPQLVECGSDHLIDPDSVREKIRAKTKAVLPVHLNGRTCNMTPILEIVQEYGLELVEDAAQSFGSKFNGQAAGSFGKAGTISFYPAKVLGSLGDAGGVLTNDDEIAEIIFQTRDHGRNRDGDMVSWGTNCRLDNLQAAFLIFQLSKFPQEISRRREIAAAYHDGLGQIEDLVLPPAPTTAGPHFDIYQNFELESSYRDELQQYLREHNVGSLIQWGGEAVHQIQALGLQTSLPATEKLFTRCLMIPMHQYLSDQDVQYVIQTIVDFYNTK